jgi:hypothetical protein
MESAQRFTMSLDRSGTLGWLRWEGSPEEEERKGIDIFDLKSGKLGKTLPIDESFTTYGGQVTEDGRFLLEHSYLVQQIAIRDLTSGNFVGIVAPESGGFGAFDLTRGDRQVIGVCGPWNQGTLKTDKIAVFELGSLTR